MLLLLGVLGGGLVVYATYWGAWAGSDSAAYLATARSLASGNGFQVLQPSGEPATLMPPLYPLLLAALNKIGIPLLDSARWLGVFFFTTTILIVGLFFIRLTHSPWLALPAGALLLSFPVILRLYSGIMSEALFLALTLVALFLLVGYITHPSRLWLTGAALACALATLARFMGIALLPVALLAIWLLQSVSLKRRLGDTGIFLLTYAIPTLIWVAWYSQQSTTSLEVTHWSNAWEYLTPVRAGLVSVLWEWLPFQDALHIQRYLLKLAVLVLLAAGVFSMTIGIGFRMYAQDRRRWLTDRDLRVFAVCALFVILYLIAFVLIYLFRYPPQDIDERTLLPLFPPLVIIIFSISSLIYRAVSARRGRVWLNFLPGMLLVLGLAAYLPQSLALAGQLHRAGAGYTSADWRTSQTIQAVLKLPADTPIISSDTGAILFFTGRMASEISESYRADPLQQFTRFGDDLDDRAQALFRQGDAALVLFFPSFYWKLHRLYQDETDRRLEAFVQGLVVYAELPDGAIYFYPKGQ